MLINEKLEAEKKAELLEGQIERLRRMQASGWWRRCCARLLVVAVLLSGPSVSGPGLCLAASLL